MSSKCIYCGSTSYGYGCPYSPDKVHVHLTPDECIYCGSKEHGYGCPYNPNGQLHVHGVNFNPMVKEALKNGIIEGLIMKYLSTPFNEMPAYGLGLIDEDGDTIKVPETISERMALAPPIKYLIRVKKLLGEKIDLLNASLYYTDDNESVETVMETYDTELLMRDEIKENMKNLTSIINEYSKKGIGWNKMEKIVLEELLNADSNSHKTE